MVRSSFSILFFIRKSKANPKRFLTYWDFYLHKITNVAIGYDKKSLEIGYICCNLKYLIWLSTFCRKLAWERATDKKIPSCLESLYSSCFQITLFLDAKVAFFSWLPVIFRHKISRSFQETYTADMTAIP